MDTRLLWIWPLRVECGGDYCGSPGNGCRRDGFLNLPEFPLQSEVLDSYRRWGFELNANVTPSAAINDIFVNGQLYAFECAMAMVMILYKATINMIGEAAFNRYFTGLYLWDWSYDSNLKLITTFNQAELQPGDVVYFKNPDHDPAKPEWQGRTPLCCPGTVTTDTDSGSRVPRR